MEILDFKLLSLDTNSFKEHDKQWSPFKKAVKVKEKNNITLTKTLSRERSSYRTRANYTRTNRYRNNLKRPAVS